MPALLLVAVLLLIDGVALALHPLKLSTLLQVCQCGQYTTRLNVAVSALTPLDRFPLRACKVVATPNFAFFQTEILKRSFLPLFPQSHTSPTTTDPQQTRTQASTTKGAIELVRILGVL